MLYVTSNVVKLMFIAYFSLMSVTVISVCVNDAVRVLYMLLFGSSCDSHHLLRYKTDFSTSIGWYINIISVNEITVFNCKFKLKP